MKVEYASAPTGDTELQEVAIGRDQDRRRFKKQQYARARQRHLIMLCSQSDVEDLDRCAGGVYRRCQHRWICVPTKTHTA